MATRTAEQNPTEHELRNISPPAADSAAEIQTPRLFMNAVAIPSPNPTEAPPAYRERGPQDYGANNHIRSDSDWIAKLSSWLTPTWNLFCRHRENLFGWVAVVAGFLLALLALIPAFISQALTEKQYELDKWQALKEFFDYCKEEKEGGHSPQDCEAAIDTDIPLPPGVHVEKEFNRLVSRMPKHLQERTYRKESSLVRPRPLTVIGTLSASLCLWAVGLYMLVKAQRRRRRREKILSSLHSIEGTLKVPRTTESVLSNALSRDYLCSEDDGIKFPISTGEGNLRGQPMAEQLHKMTEVLELEAFGMGSDGSSSSSDIPPYDNSSAFALTDEDIYEANARIPESSEGMDIYSLDTVPKQQQQQQQQQHFKWPGDYSSDNDTDFENPFFGVTFECEFVPCPHTTKDWNEHMDHLKQEHDWVRPQERSDRDPNSIVLFSDPLNDAPLAPYDPSMLNSAYALQGGPSWDELRRSSDTSGNHPSANPFASNPWHVEHSSERGGNQKEVMDFCSMDTSMPFFIPEFDPNPPRSGGEKNYLEYMWSPQPSSSINQFASGSGAFSSADPLIWTEDDEMSLRERELQLLEKLRGTHSKRASKHGEDVTMEIRSLRNDLERTKELRQQHAYSMPHYIEETSSSSKSERHRSKRKGISRKDEGGRSRGKSRQSGLHDELEAVLNGTWRLLESGSSSETMEREVEHEKVSSLLSDWLGEEDSVPVGGSYIDDIMPPTTGRANPGKARRRR